MSRRNQSKATVEALMNKAEQIVKAEELKTAEQTAEAVEEQTAEASKSFAEMTKTELAELLKLSATEQKKLKKEELIKLATEQSKAEATETAEAEQTATAEQKQSKAKIDSKAEAEAVKKLCKTAEATTNSEGHIIIKAKGYLLKIQISSRAIKLRCNQKFANASKFKTEKHDGWNVKYELFCTYKEAVEKLEELAKEQTAEAEKTA